MMEEKFEKDVNALEKATLCISSITGVCSAGDLAYCNEDEPLHHLLSLKLFGEQIQSLSQAMLYSYYAISCSPQGLSFCVILILSPLLLPSRVLLQRVRLITDTICNLWRLL